MKPMRRTYAGANHAPADMSPVTAVPRACIRQRDAKAPFKSANEGLQPQNFDPMRTPIVRGVSTTAYGRWVQNPHSS